MMTTATDGSTQHCSITSATVIYGRLKIRAIHVNNHDILDFYFIAVCTIQEKEENLDSISTREWPPVSERASGCLAWSVSTEQYI